MTTVTTRSTMPAAPADSRKTALSALLAACRLEDGARWALIGAAITAVVVAILALQAV